MSVMNIPRDIRFNVFNLELLQTQFQPQVGLVVAKTFNKETNVYEGYRVDKVVGSIQRQNEARDIPGHGEMCRGKKRLPWQSVAQVTQKFGFPAVAEQTIQAGRER